MIGETVRPRLGGAGLQRMSLPPGNWGAPPEGNRSRLFLDNEKHTVFWEIPCGQQGAPVPLTGGERNGLVNS